MAHIHNSDYFGLMIEQHQPEEASDWDDPVQVLIRREEQIERERALLAAEKAATERLKARYAPQRKVLYLIR